MAFRYITRPRSGGSTRAFDTDVLAWKSAVEANGGSVSLARLIIVDQFVFSEKAAGTWALTDDYLGFWAENAPQALTSLKQRRLATAVNSPVFTPDRDYTFDGATSYIATGFVPGTHGVNYTSSMQDTGIYSRVNLSSAGTNAGAITNAANNKIFINARNGTNMQGGANTPSGTPGTFALSPADSRGLKVVGRSVAGSMYGFDRGVRLTDHTGLTTSNNIQTHEIYIGCVNNIGTPASFRAAATGLWVIGGPMSDGQQASRYANVQAWGAAVGASV